MLPISLILENEWSTLTTQGADNMENEKGREIRWRLSVQ
jgi:hypothetical protein